MPRPTRIQYEDAVYHVMNRGRGRQTIFHEETYYQAFLETLEEAYSRFDAVIHAYCLMGNHYHLLIQTPRANLDRIMRHINGVYTQRYNRLKKTDGALFRGRYKAILVDKDAYLLQLSRYIHRNPIEVKRPLVTDLAAYPWSSYPAYINQAQAEPWLHRETIYRMLGHKQPYAGYRRYVMDGNDEELLRFYNKGNLSAVLGEQAFREEIALRKEEFTGSEDFYKQINMRPGINEIVQAVSKVMAMPVTEILKRKQGRQASNTARKVAMYVCQQYGDMSLKVIANEFGLTRESSVSPAIADVKSNWETLEIVVSKILIRLKYIK